MLFPIQFMPLIQGGHIRDMQLILVLICQEEQTTIDESSCVCKLIKKQE
jgi:hypothetical protein